MTAPVETAIGETTPGVGRVARVTGPVVDVEFPVEAMPELRNALHVVVSFGAGEEGGGTRTLTRQENQARQAEITQEISEIVGGADALSSATAGR